MRQDYIFTSESVTEGHPDKIADQISDAILDAILARDKHGRVAVETCLKTGFALVAGEVTTSCYVAIPDIVRKTICDIGYTSSEMGFDGNTCAVMVAIERQSEDIGQGVNPDTNQDGELGAGDQGMMFGFACNDTDDLMPAPIAYAHQLSKALASARRGDLKYLRPDGKSQVSVEYEDGVPKRISAVVVSTQHSEETATDKLRREIEELVIRQTLPAELLTNDTKIHINPTGRFVVGGPMGDAGLTGRKIIVDTYGGMGRHGGGAFSGKDPTKVDRSAAYMGRYVAKNVVAAGLARKVEVQVAYAIGRAEPVSILVDTFGTGVVSDKAIEEAIRATFGFKPQQIIETLDLLRPIYLPTAAYGHFGRKDPDFFWERTDRAAELAEAAGSWQRLRG